MFIQLVQISDETKLFLYGINSNNEIIFRTSKNFNYLQNETYFIKNNICYLSFYTFDKVFLNNLPKI